ncbi:MAG: hypothetical protein C0491_06250 [Novosphingobium sp.]|nr:hypothetical protein [Novosphingobium sp.]
MLPKMFSGLGTHNYPPERVAEVEAALATIMDGTFAGGWAELDEVLAGAGLADAFAVVERMSLFLDEKAALYRSVGDEERAAAADDCRANLATWMPTAK